MSDDSLKELKTILEGKLKLVKGSYDDFVEAVPLYLNTKKEILYVTHFIDANPDIGTGLILKLTVLIHQKHPEVMELVESEIIPNDIISSLSP